MTKNLTLRLPEDFHKVLRVEAATKGVSLHEYILSCLYSRPPLNEVRLRPDRVVILDPPLDAQGIAGVKEALVAEAAGDTGKPWPEVKKELDIKPPCTCTPAERRRPKGKLGPHKLGCPARE